MTLILFFIFSEIYLVKILPNKIIKKKFMLKSFSHISVKNFVIFFKFLLNLHKLYMNRSEIPPVLSSPQKVEYG